MILEFHFEVMIILLVVYIYMGHSMSGGPPFGLCKSDLDSLDRASLSERFIDLDDRPICLDFITINYLPTIRKDRNCHLDILIIIFI